MTMPMIVLLLAAAAATLLVLLIVVAVAQSLNKTGTPTPAEAAAEAAASVVAAVATYTGKTGAATTPTPAHKHGRTPKPARAFASAASASRAAAHKSHTAKGAAKDAAAAAAAEDKQKQTKATVTGLAYFGGAIAVIGGVVGFVTDLNDGDIAPEIKELTAGALHGTMVNARNSDPIVLIVPGSGPTDRDGNNPMGVNADTYRILADELIEERIATVRIDKRGMFASKLRRRSQRRLARHLRRRHPCLDRRHQGRSRRRIGLRVPDGPFRRRADGLSRGRRSR
jgi:hypothetical protein